MKSKKKGQLSLNTIIIAAIVLIVLIVLWLIFSGKMGGFTKGLNETSGKEARDKAVEDIKANLQESTTNELTTQIDILEIQPPA